MFIAADFYLYQRSFIVIAAKKKNFEFFRNALDIVKAQTIYGNCRFTEWVIKKY